MSKVPLYLSTTCMALRTVLGGGAGQNERDDSVTASGLLSSLIREHLAHTKTPPPLGPSWAPRHRPTVGS